MAGPGVQIVSIGPALISSVIRCVDSAVSPATPSDKAPFAWRQSYSNGVLEQQLEAQSSEALANEFAHPTFAKPPSAGRQANPNGLSGTNSRLRRSRHLSGTSRLRHQSARRRRALRSALERPLAQFLIEDIGRLREICATTVACELQEAHLRLELQRVSALRGKSYRLQMKCGSADMK